MPDRIFAAGAVPVPAMRERMIVGLVSASPMAAFAITLAVSKSLPVAACLAMLAAILVSWWRIATGRSLRMTLAVVAVVAVQVTLATVSGHATNFFLPRLVWTVCWSPVHLVLILIGWPPLGWAVGQLRGEPWAWHRCRVQRRAYQLASLLPWSWATVSMVLSLWLYLHGQVELLAGVEMVDNAIHVVAFLAAWRIARRIIGSHRCEDELVGSKEIS